MSITIKHQITIWATVHSKVITVDITSAVYCSNASVGLHSVF